MTQLPALETTNAARPLQAASPDDVKRLYDQLYVFAADLQRALRDREAAYKQLYSYVEDLHRALAVRDGALGAAKAAERAKSAFLANVSHEFRTPLTAILGFSDILREGEARELEKEFLTRIHLAGKRMEGLVENLLTLASLEAGDLHSEHAVCDVAKVARESVRAAGEKAQAKSLSLTLHEPEEPLLPVLTDGAKLRHVLDALLDNAIKFTAAGSVQVEITADAKSGLPLTISVADTGIGIAPAVAERIFSPFAQGDDSSTRAHDGVGLGLSLARSLLAMIRAELKFSTTPGEGSVFTIHLPVPTSGDPAPAAASSPIR